MLNVLAPAKINLLLEVLGKRTDGYHQISSLVQAVDLCDEITFAEADAISFECDAPELSGEDNLVVKAARLLKEYSLYSGGAAIRLKKVIPWASGLGGGSSDAAATLLALNRLWKLGLPLTELAGLASRLGSDVPFFLYDGTALVSGRGELVEPLKVRQQFWYVILLPPFPRVSQKTRRMYESLPVAAFTTGELVPRAAESLRTGSFTYRMLYNAFETVITSVFPGYYTYVEKLLQAGAYRVCLAGSGPAMFSLVESESKGAAIQEGMKALGLECYLASTFRRNR